jgi:DNA-binding transcriptional LysR family regulator
MGPLRLIVPGRGNARRERIDAYLSAVGADIQALIEMDAMMGTLELIACSNWRAILPGAVCDADVHGTVRSLHPLVDPPLFVDYVQIHSSARVLSGAVAAFAAVLRRHIKRVAGRWWDESIPADESALTGPTHGMIPTPPARTKSRKVEVGSD